MATCVQHLLLFNGCCTFYNQHNELLYLLNKGVNTVIFFNKDKYRKHSQASNLKISHL